MRYRRSRVLGSVSLLGIFRKDNSLKQAISRQKRPRQLFNVFSPSSSCMIVFRLSSSLPVVPSYRSASARSEMRYDFSEARDEMTD